MKKYQGNLHDSLACKNCWMDANVLNYFNMLVLHFSQCLLLYCDFSASVAQTCALKIGRIYLTETNMLLKLKWKVN